MESLKIAKCVLESPCKVLEVFVQKRVRALYLNPESNTYWQSTCAGSFVGK